MNISILPRRFALTLLIALVLPLLIACGGQAPATGTSTQATSAPEAAPTEAAPAAEPTQAAPTEAEPTEAAMEPTEAEPTDAATEAPAATDSPPAEAPTGDKILRVQISTYPDVVDPQKSSFANEIGILQLIYEGLTTLDKDLKAVPGAAEKWEFNDTGDQITFTLREGLTYSDGTPLTSENFRYSIERTCDPETAGEYQSILFEIVGCADFATAPVTDTAALEAGQKKLSEEGIQTPDERTITLNLTNPAPYFPFIAGLWVMYPARQDLIEPSGDTWWQDPANQIGNGPFKVTQMEPDQLVSFVPNENYWAGRTKLDGFEYVFIKDTSVALEAYRSGQVEIMVPDPSQLPALREDPTFKEELLIYPGANTYAWGFNLTKEPFTDKKVREAFAYALDRNTYCEVIRNGDCIPTLSWIPKGVTGYVETDKYAYDPEAAKQALAESSYGGPDALPEIKLTYNSDDPAAQPRIEWIAGQLRDVLGINVVLDPTDGTTLQAMRKEAETYPQVCIFCSNWFQDYPDPQNWLSVLWRCGGISAQRVGYCNDEFDKLTLQADVELDPDKRVQLYQQAGEILIDDQAFPFVYNLANIFLVKPEVTGLTPTPGDATVPGQWGSVMTADITR